MKSFVFGLVVLLGISGAYAVDNATKEVKLDPRRISESICLFYVLGYGIVKPTKKTIKNHMRAYTETKSANNEQIAAYLNKHKDDMVCGDDNKLYTKVAFERGAHLELFEDLIFDQIISKKVKEPTLLDMNAVDFSNNGKPETLLDYIDNIIAVWENDKTDSVYSDDGIQDVKDIRDILFIDFKAKTFTQLPADLQAKYLKQAKAKE